VSNNKKGASMAWNDNNQTPPELDEVIKILKINLIVLLVENLQGAHQVALVQAKLQKEALSTS
jgi:hypothetical protein